MKKFFKVTAIVLGSLLTLTFLTWLVVPAFPAYMLVKSRHKDEVELLNYTTAPYTHGDVETPDDFVKVEYEGISVKMPSYMYKKYPDDYENQDVAERFFVDGEKDKSVIFIENTDMDFTTEEYEAYKGINYKTPENLYEFYDMIYTVKLDDCSVFKHNSSQAMLALSENKYCVSHGTDLTVYKIENENAVGFIHMAGHMPKNEKDDERYWYVIELFDKNDLDVMHTVSVFSKDQQTVWQIVNSVDTVDMEKI